MDPVRITRIMKLMEKMHKHLCSFFLSQVRFLGQRKIVYSVKRRVQKRIGCCPSKKQGMGSRGGFSGNLGANTDIKACDELKVQQMINFNSKKVKVISATVLPFIL